LEQLLAHIVEQWKRKGAKTSPVSYGGKVSGVQPLAAAQEEGEHEWEEEITAQVFISIKKSTPKTKTQRNINQGKTGGPSPHF